MSKRLISLSLALLLAVTASIVPQQRTAAFGYMYGDPYYYAQSEIRWCIAENPWTSWHVPNTIRAAFSHWDGKMDRRTFKEVHPTDGCKIHIYIRNFYNTSWPSVHDSTPAAAMFWYSAIAGTIDHSNIYINSHYVNDFWFSTSYQDCRVGIDCEPFDFYSVVSHEIGHAVGLSHNKEYTDYPCVHGYDNERTDLACLDDFYSRDIMYPQSADGYRRWITEDTLRGLRALNYRW